MRDFQNVSAQQWVDRISRIAPRILCAAFVVGIAWELVQATWLLLEREPHEPIAIASPSPAATEPRRTVNVQAIVDAHLFGVEQGPALADAAQAPQTRMNLVLAGTWALDDPSKGFAFIGESAGTAKMFAVGKAVRPGTTLHSVYPDRVILDTNGKLEALLLPRPSSGNLTALARPAPRPAPMSANQTVENLRRMAESNPQAFAEIMRPQPVFANGVQRGYRVYPGRNRQQFARLGLQPGDLVTAINGTPLDDPQRGMEIFNTIGSADRVTVTIERNGQSQELSLNMAQLSIPENSAPTNRSNPIEGPSAPE
jgi:general secretion pathway protein C